MSASAAELRMRAQTASSASEFKRLTTEAQLNRALEASRERPVVLFKHSSTCGVSAAAYEEMVDVVDVDAGEWYLIDVRTHRPVSNAIATRLGVRHESPQVLVIGGGRVRWHGSHFQVTASAVRAAVKKATV